MFGLRTTQPEHLQDQYVGDIGDYAKYGLLRALLAGSEAKLGVNWHLHPDEERKRDGRFVEYLDKRDEWSRHDCELFNVLAAIVREDRRGVGAIEAPGVLRNAVFAGHEMNNYKCVSKVERRKFREDWLSEVKVKLKDCDIVFADPDNGLYDASEPDWSDDTMWKRILLSEAKSLAEDGNGCSRTLIIYHHNTRRKGGHAKEVGFWKAKLGADTLAVRWRGRSPRTFFVVNPRPRMCALLNNFMAGWNEGKPKSRLLWTPG